MSTRSEDYENDDFSGFGKVKLKSYESRVKHNNSMELSGYPFFNLC